MFSRWMLLSTMRMVAVSSSIRRTMQGMAESPASSLPCLRRCSAMISYGLEQVYHVIDGRSRSEKPLIVTTNLTLQELKQPQDTAHARIYDRLLVMCAPVYCNAANFRKEAAQAKLDSLKELWNDGKESL
mgnify:CR=1 FL=1